MAAVVLIVDDNEHLRGIFAQVLRSHGYETLEAATGFEAIAKTSSTRPNLILMDFDLPDMTGADAARAIKSDPATGTIPIIGCSALGAEFRDAAIEAGMVDYLIKPVSLERIRGKVAEFILLNDASHTAETSGRIATPAEKATRSLDARADNRHNPRANPELE